MLSSLLASLSEVHILHSPFSAQANPCYIIGYWEDNICSLFLFFEFLNQQKSVSVVCIEMKVLGVHGAGMQLYEGWEEVTSLYLKFKFKLII